jgi:DNA-binding transcriptional ArsR family regulator
MTYDVLNHAFQPWDLQPEPSDDDPDASWDSISRNKHRGNPNSLAAAASITPVARVSIREKVLAYIADHPEGVTYEDVLVGLDLFHPTVSSALSLLKKHDLVRVSGGRLTSRGRMAAVYFIAKGNP